MSIPKGASGSPERTCYRGPADQCEPAVEVIALAFVNNDPQQENPGKTQPALLFDTAAAIPSGPLVRGAKETGVERRGALRVRSECVDSKQRGRLTTDLCPPYPTGSFGPPFVRRVLCLPRPLCVSCAGVRYGPNAFPVAPALGAAAARRAGGS